MKRLALSTLVLLALTSSFAFAGDAKTENVEQAKQDSYFQLCAAAMESKAALRKKARELKITRRKMDNVMCNDMTVAEFAHYYEVTGQSAIATVQ